MHTVYKGNEKKKSYVDSPSLTIMFSKECLASQQLRNTGMKRFLKEGRITCQEDKASVCLAVTFLITVLSVRSRIITRKAKGCAKLFWNLFCSAVLNVWHAIKTRQWESSTWHPLTVIMKGTALIISRMKGTCNTCSQTLPWKQTKKQNKKHTHTGVRKLHCHIDLQGLPLGLISEGWRRRTDCFVTGMYKGCTTPLWSSILAFHLWCQPLLFLCVSHLQMADLNLTSVGGRVCPQESVSCKC